VTESAGAEGLPSPVTTLKETEPPDDAGAETFDRYEWQATMAAADVLAAFLGCLDVHGALRDDATFEVICEHHEDWALSDGQTAEIVSGKHRETQVGAFTTVYSLLVDGGVLHLLDRWLALGRTPNCRLVTTAGVADDARALMEAAQAFATGTADGAAFDAIMEKFGKAVMRARATKADTSAEGAAGSSPEALGEDRQTLAAFLQVLRIQHSEPSRDYAPLLAARAYARPVAAHLSVSDAEDAIWAAVLGLVRERMRAAGPRRRGRLPTVFGASHEQGYEVRTVTVSDVAVAIRVAINNQAGFRPLPRRIRTSKVAIKMGEGGCSDNTVERAESLRRQYRQHWREVQATPSIDPTQRRVENVLLRVIDEATEVVRVADETWGRALWWEVQARLDEIADGDRAHGLDADLLLGGVSELSNECRAWFSESFDVEAVALHLAQEATGVTGTRPKVGET
jgi:hypothetical protein